MITPDHKDRTATQRFASCGVPYRKTCTRCGQYREISGGSMRGKLRLWRCRDCTQTSARSAPGAP